MRCGDKVVDVRGNGDRVVRIFIAEYQGLYLLVHSGEEEIFHSALGGAITYWADEVKEIPTLDMGIDSNDITDLIGVINENSILTKECVDSCGNINIVNFMTKDELQQRSY